MNHKLLLNTEMGRQRMVDAFLNFTWNTSLAAQEKEKELLTQFVKGELTIEQVVDFLEAPSDGPVVGHDPIE